MALRTPPRPVKVAGPATGSGSGGGFLRKLVIVVVLAVVAAVVGYVLKDKIPGMAPEPISALSATAFKDYEKFWNDHPEGVPPELSVGTVTGLANDCMYGGLSRNTPLYLGADQIGRPRGG